MQEIGLRKGETEMNEDEDNWPVYDGEEGRDATYRAIGCFITRFASVEMAMRHAIAQEVKIDFQFYHAVMTQDFAMLCSAFNAVFSHTLKTEDEKKRLKAVVSRARQLNDVRVKVVHGTQWEEDYDGGTLLHVSRQSLKMQELKGMAAFLDKEADNCSEVFGELCGLFLRVDPHGPEVSEAEVLASLSDLLGLAKEGEK
jgi:hypothetical protein